MKRLLTILILISLISNEAISKRIISSFDIARWYLDADLVLVCSVNTIDSILIKQVDSICSDNLRLRYDFIQEEYSITVDSILKNKGRIVGLIDTIRSQEFKVNYSHSSQGVGEFDHVNDEGDSMYVVEFSYNMMDGYFDDTYFRLDMDRKYIVILSEVNDKLIIDYKDYCHNRLLKMLVEVDAKGELYFNRLDGFE